jgi:hypothetical protein
MFLINLAHSPRTPDLRKPYLTQIHSKDNISELVRNDLRFTEVLNTAFTVYWAWELMRWR